MELRIKILQKDQNCHMSLPCSLKILTKLKFQISKFDFCCLPFNVYDAQALTDRTERAKLAVGLKKDAKKLSQNSTRKYIYYFSKYSNSQWTTTH